VPGDTVLEVPLPESLLAAERAQAAAR
jgi:hypothetical protein